MTEPVRFVVEHAGCESCAARVNTALAGLIAIDEITIDEGDDAAVVRAQAPAGLELATVDAALAGASHGSGHTYRVSPDSWPSSSESRRAGRG
jgi:Heavy-metal-associated domain